MYINRERVKEFCRFCLVGISNTGVDFSVFFVLVWLAVPHLAAQVAAYSAGVANSFILNRVWTFQIRDKMTGREVNRFVLINVVSLLVSTAALYSAHDLAGAPLLAAKIAATGLAVMVNYAGSRYWVFPKKCEEQL